MWTPARIINARFQATINPGDCSPLLETIPLILPLTFTGVSAVEIYRGIYTPNNDYLYLFQNRPYSVAPNFMMLLCGGQININLGFSSGASSLQSHTRFFFDSWLLDPTNFMNNVYIEGRTAAQSAMPQGVAVDYTVIIGQAAIS